MQVSHRGKTKFLDKYNYINNPKDKDFWIGWNHNFHICSLYLLVCLLVIIGSCCRYEGGKWERLIKTALWRRLYDLCQDFPGSPVVRTPRFHCRGHRSHMLCGQNKQTKNLCNIIQGTKIPHAAQPNIQKTYVILFFCLELILRGYNRKMLQSIFVIIFVPLYYF